MSIGNNIKQHRLSCAWPCPRLWRLALVVFAQWSLADDDGLVVDAILTGKSDEPRLESIAPYREALVLYEYEVRRVIQGSCSTKTIRVAHWGIYDRMKQPAISYAQGLLREHMRLTPLEQAGDFVKQCRRSDTLTESFDIPLYFELGQKIEAAPVTDQRWNYDCSLGEKMGWFFPVHHQLRLVAVGDSRTYAGVNPWYFFGEENQAHPVAFNLGINGAGVDAVSVVLREYASHLPQLKWVVWGLSPRMFNKGFKDAIKDRLTRSPGYAYDSRHPLLVWDKPTSGLVLPRKPQHASDADAWGFFDHGAYFVGDYRKQFHDAEAMRRVQKLAQNPQFDLSADRLHQFALLLDEFNAKEVRILGFTPPVHRVLAGQPCTDDDRTSREGYDSLVLELRKLAGTKSNFFFIDVNRKSENIFDDEDFANFDHLNARGAAKLSKILSEVITNPKADWDPVFSGTAGPADTR